MDLVPLACEDGSEERSGLAKMAQRNEVDLVSLACEDGSEE